MDVAAGLADVGPVAGLTFARNSRLGSVLGLAQFGKQVAINFVAIAAYFTGIAGTFLLGNRCHHPATGLMQMGAVVKLAVRHVRFDVRHVGRQLRWVDVVQAKLLKAR